MDPDPYNGPIPGFHFRPASTPTEKLNRRSIAAFLVPAIGYLLLAATTTPHDLGLGLWAGLTLLLLPITGGLIVHSVGEECSARQRMTRGFLLSFIGFVLYGLVNMALIHDRIRSSSGSGAFVAIALTAVAYGLLAGVVGGLCASLPEKHEEHGW